MGDVKGTDFNQLALAAKHDAASFQRLYTVLYAERRRFMLNGMVVAGGIDAEAVFNDALLSAVDEYTGEKGFVGLLRLRLDSRAIDAYRAETIRRRHEAEESRMSELTRSTQLFSVNSVEFRDFVSTHKDARVRQAFGLMLDDGSTLTATTNAIGGIKVGTLKKLLQQALAQFLDLQPEK